VNRPHDLTERAAHFEFGENWQSYAATIERKQIDAAIAGVRKLFPDGLHGRSFLDIGCGSGLHALAALSLGASSVTAIDIDENSVAATKQTLSRFAPKAKWSASVLSVFDAISDVLGQFDVVYSWGVLHHTGDMWRAIEKATGLVKKDGAFAIAIYNATSMDRFWAIEKRFYSALPRPGQWLIRQGFIAAWLAGKAVRGTSPVAYLRDYHHVRGMNFSHDAHDWLGGYPYETASAEGLRAFFASRGFMEERGFPKPKSIGLFGSICHEFVFRKACPPEVPAGQ
jgi:2-polyprenyl-6-hydroxyphenyl methylase/3-demethylubiquinone-9 3-methyltransferase